MSPEDVKRELERVLGKAIVTPPLCDPVADNFSELRWEMAQARGAESCVVARRRELELLLEHFDAAQRRRPLVEDIIHVLRLGAAGGPPLLFEQVTDVVTAIHCLGFRIVLPDGRDAA